MYPEANSYFDEQCKTTVSGLRVSGRFTIIMHSTAAKSFTINHTLFMIVILQIPHVPTVSLTRLKDYNMDVDDAPPESENTNLLPFYRMEKKDLTNRKFFAYGYNDFDLKELKSVTMTTEADTIVYPLITTMKLTDDTRNIRCLVWFNYIFTT